MTDPGEIDRIFIDLETRARNFKQEWAMEFQRRVEQRTPVRTGHLQASWLTEQSQTGIKVSNVADYAYYVENGTPHMAPVKMMATTILEKDQITQVALEKVKK